MQRLYSVIGRLTGCNSSRNGEHYEGEHPAEGLVSNCTNKSSCSPTHVTNAKARSTFVPNNAFVTVIWLALSFERYPAEPIDVLPVASGTAASFGSVSPR